MKRGVNIERFRLWKVNPRGVLVEDGRRERLIWLLTSAAQYFGIEAPRVADVPETMSFADALHHLAKPLGIKAFPPHAMTWRLPMIARDKEKDDAVLLVPRGRHDYAVLDATHETITNVEIAARFDEILYLRRSSLPVEKFDRFIKKIGAITPKIANVVVSFVLAITAVLWVMVAFTFQSDFGEENRIVLFVLATIFACVIAITALMAEEHARARFGQSYLWLFDQVFRRYLAQSARSLARMSAHDVEALLRGMNNGLTNLFVTQPRIILIGVFLVVTITAFFIQSALLMAGFVGAALAVTVGLLQFKRRVQTIQSGVFEQRQQLYRELTHYARARTALFGLEQTQSTTLRLACTLGGLTRAYERLVRIKQWLALVYLLVPVFLVVTTLMLMSSTLDAWPSYRLAANLVLVVTASFGVVYLGEKMGALKQHGFDQAALDVVNMMPTASLAAHVEPVQSQGAIDLLNVTFAHEDSGLVIVRDYSLVIRPKDCVVIAGPSGVGKTTLLKILCGLNRPHEGEVIYDGQDMRALNPISLRNKFGVVFENTDLFAGSIYNNILCGRAIAPKALETLLLTHEVFDMLLDLPMALETFILDHGKNISRLERTTILLARALLHRPVFLFLDEIFGGLSLKDQRIIGDYLMSLNITRVVTSLSTNIPLKGDVTIVMPIRTPDRA